CARYAFMDYW
nr:immunoglobulin heavy chain junction region [Mus musculus]